jgi:LPS export ABC transporter permease LptF/LPS export ABC transporter permease LptG
MLSGKKLIPRYVIGAVLPYLLISLVLLTAVLFAQQSGRFAELALYAQVPFSLFSQLAIALLPSVLVFTLPMSVLAGIVIGFARMGSDSEIVAMRAAGVGTWSMLWPVLLVGLVVAGTTTYINMREAPRAARDIRKAALQGALRKLDSPVEPGVFNTDIPGYVIYVRDGDKTRGSWGRVFIYSQEADATTRVITARSGRIDSSGDKSELVLNDAVATKMPPAQAAYQRSYVVERLDQLRIALDTGRAEILDRLKQDEVGPDEMTWSDLEKQAHDASITNRREAQRTLHRRMALSVSPFLFALLGGALGVRVRRGGRGVGILLAIGVVIVYYLISLLGESLARNQTVSPFVGLWLATGLMALLSFVLLAFNRVPLDALIARRIKTAQLTARKPASQIQSAHIVGAGRSGFPSLLDISLFRTLAISFLLGFASLVSIFIIFTLFELWRFIGANRIRLGLVAKYVLFLLPLITVEIFPATILIAVLITYALIAKRSEAIAWWACGQSVYRLMLPGLLFAVAAGAGTWLVQEHLMPSANVRQDALRAQIKGSEARATTGAGRQWLASAENNRVYSYEFDEQNGTLHEPEIYELDGQAVHLATVTTGSTGLIAPNGQMVIKDSETLSLRGREVERQIANEKQMGGVESVQVFKPTIDKPSQLSANGLSAYLRSAKRRGVEVSALALALQRKYAGPFSVIVMAFIGMPLALSFGRRGAIIALCVAVGVSVAYWGIGGGFQQLGNHGLLPPAVAAWFPPVIFAAAGIYFLSRVRT